MSCEVIVSSKKGTVVMDKVSCTSVFLEFSIDATWVFVRLPLGTEPPPIPDPHAGLLQEDIQRRSALECYS